MTAPDPAVGDGTGSASAVDRDALEKLTRTELHDQYNVPESGGTKGDWIDRIVANEGQPLPDPVEDGATVRLRIAPASQLASQEHYWDQKADPITAEGTAVPADKVEQIIADAATGGIRIEEVK